jgi:Fe-S oxidoreductase
MAKLKAEFMQHYYDEHGVPWRSRLIANFVRTSQMASVAPWAWNFVVERKPLRRLLYRMVGFHPERSMPSMNPQTVKQWHNQRSQHGVHMGSRRVYLFLDEFTDFNDSPVGQKSIQLLERLGYDVVIPPHVESARTWLSKGLIRQAREIAVRNVRLLGDLASEDTPLVGIEPSAILGFRDEYIDLVGEALRPVARKLASNALMLEEFLVREHRAGRIDKSTFTGSERRIKLHGHCFQKALASVQPTIEALQIPENYAVEVIPSGCCGMAGSFGYEKEHYELSMQIGELVLFPAVRSADPEALIAAPGTSCRHQIKDGAGRMALHPAEILFDALDFT